FCAPRIEEGEVLEAVKRELAKRAGIAAAADATQGGPLDGFLDVVAWDMVSGWARQTEHPDVPARLEIMDGDRLLARVVANRFRQDLRDAGMGDGRCGFEVMLPRGLNPAETHAIHVRRAEDKAELKGSPMLLETAETFDPAARARFAASLEAKAAAAHSPAEVDEMIDFLVAETDRMLNARALLADGMPDADQRRRMILGRWHGTPATRASTKAGAGRVRHALVIDDALPKPDRDAGSNAVLSHIRSLKRLGWQVSFVPSRETARVSPYAEALEAEGVTCLTAPYYASVEEVLRRSPHAFELVYLHRLSNASAYATLVRQHCRQARILYSVADLHHLRIARQAAVEQRQELVEQARRVQQQELLTMRLCDATITHSTAEATLLSRIAAGAEVHVVPWAVKADPGAVGFARRRGVGFVAGFRHLPNQDAVKWLLGEIMPRVWAQDASIPCVVAGSDMPADLAAGWADDERVTVLGHVADLGEVFDRVRLTVAPLRYGAGVKGKVLDSLAHGIPCVMTAIAGEGIPLPAALGESVADTADAIAAAILRLHGSAAANTAAVNAGLKMIRGRFTEAAIDAALDAAAHPACETAKPAAPVLLRTA
ncbi:MAG TPA: glycosyltransferase, partial [Acetobacteraceae bacterium]|nr:glycosyltransferase [Acetobacteraceae bacterium]